MSVFSNRARTVKKSETSRINANTFDQLVCKQLNKLAKLAMTA